MRRRTPGFAENSGTAPPPVDVLRLIRSIVAHALDLCCCPRVAARNTYARRGPAESAPDAWRGEVCAGRLTLQQAQQDIRTDWSAAAALRWRIAGSIADRSPL